MNDKYKKYYELLEKELARVKWDALNDHYKRDAVFIISPELSLLDVATKIAIDDADAIRQWMKNKEIRKPSGDEIIELQNDNAREFDFIIVQPYVLVQEYLDIDLD